MKIGEIPIKIMIPLMEANLFCMSDHESTTMDEILTLYEALIISQKRDIDDLSNEHKRSLLYLSELKKLSISNQPKPEEN